MHTKLPWKALREHEGYFEPDAEDAAAYAARPFTRIENDDGEVVVNAHDCFTFKPGDAELIVRSVNEIAELRKQLETAEQALRSIALFSPVTAEGCTLADIAFDAMTGLRGPDWHRQAPNPAL